MLMKINELSRRKHFDQGSIDFVTPHSPQIPESRIDGWAAAGASTPLRRLLVLIGPHQAEAAFLRYALRFAQPRRTEVHLAIMGGAGAALPFVFGPARRMDSTLGDLARRLGHEVVLHRIGADAEPALALRRLALSREIEIMFMVTQGGPGLLSVFLKAAHERIVRLAPCPVVSVPEDALRGSLDGSAVGWPLRTILALVRFPPHTAEDLRLAGVLADQFAAKVDLLMVHEKAQPAVTGGPGRRQSRAVHKLELNRQLARWAAQAIPGPVRGRSLTSVGVPFCQATLEAARTLQPDLIAVGVPSRRWRVHARVDRGTERVLRRATQPVLFVPEPESEQTCSLKDVWAEVLHRDFKRTHGARLHPSRSNGIRKAKRKRS